MPKIFCIAGAGDAKPHVFIATPSYGAFSPNYTASLAKTMLAVPHMGFRASICLVTGDCHVDDARNSCVNQFLQSTCDQLIFIDSDVGWEPEGLLALIRADRDVVAGVYPLKQQIEGYPVLPGECVELWSDADGLVEVKGVPTGFLKLSRSMVERMVEAHGQRKYIGSHQSKTDLPMCILFERTYQDGTRYSGDYAFCKKWLAIGGKIYVDPEIPLSHSGEFEWAGTLGDYWKRIHGVKAAENAKKFGVAIEALKAGEMDAKAIADLCEGWDNRAAAPAELLATCWHMAKEAGGPIVECGSGLSTIVMALANPDVTVHALECEPVWAMKLQEALQEHGIGNVALSCRPIKTYPEGRWYADIPGSPALALIDGPWRAHGRRDLAYEFLDLSNATVIVDDVNDPNEGNPAREWAGREGRKFHILGNGRFAVIPK